LEKSKYFNNLNKNVERILRVKRHSDQNDLRRVLLRT